MSVERLFSVLVTSRLASCTSAVSLRYGYGWARLLVCGLLALLAELTMRYLEQPFSNGTLGVPTYLVGVPQYGVWNNGREGVCRETMHSEFSLTEFVSSQEGTSITLVSWLL